MKGHFTLSIILFCLSFTVQAKTRTVNNNQNLPGNPGQYTTINAAITASSPGDTILVAGSPNNYAAFALSKKLIIIGTGYNPDKQNPLRSVIDGATLNSSSTTNASGSQIIGIKVSSIDFAFGAALSDVIIRRCEISNITFSDSTNNLKIIENIISAQFRFSPTSQRNLLISNNIFLSTGNPVMIFSSTAKSNYTPVTITNNLFLSGSKSQPLISSNWNRPFQYVANSIISNNIFYNMNPTPDTASAVGHPLYGHIGRNNTFNNNISYAGASLPTMPPKNNSGSGNKNNTDPMFTTIFSSSTNPTLDFNLDDLRLKTGSPAIKAGTDGTDIGPTGGLYPIYRSTNRYLTGEPTVPEIKEMDFIGNSAVAPGGTLQIKIKAKKIN